MRSQVVLPITVLIVLILHACSNPNESGPEALGADPSVPSSAATAAIATPLPEDGPTMVVRRAVVTLAGRYFEPVTLAQLYAEAWEGASTALRRAGITEVPPVPDYPADPDGAAAVHERTFPDLERLAEGRISTDDLIDAAVRALVTRRDDCHTRYVPAAQARQIPSQPTGGPPIRIGFAWQRDPVVHIAEVVPGSPAEAAGLRAGLRLVAINGTQTAGITDPAIAALIDRREGAPNRFTVADATGQTREVTVSAGVIPLVTHRILPGGIGLIRFDEFTPGKEIQQALIAAVADLEAAGVAAWMLDLRWNRGGAEGSMIDTATLFVEEGVLFRRVFRGQQLFTYKAEQHPTKLPVQRPLAVLVGPPTVSAAEVVAGSLQAVGRAVLVGEPTTGCIGRTQRDGISLANGSLLFITDMGVALGPDERLLNGIGLTPDVVVSRTFADLEAGRDPQLEAAVRVLQEQINGR